MTRLDRYRMNCWGRFTSYKAGRRSYGGTAPGSKQHAGRSPIFPQDTGANANALANLGNAYYFEGKLHLLDECWQKAIEIYISAGDTYNAVELMGNFGRVCCHEGELQRAEALCKHALQLLASEHNSYPRLLGAIERDYSDLLRERGGGARPDDPLSTVE